MREFPRTARLNHLVQEIVADEIERLDDERLGFLTVVAVEVAPDLRHAIVWYSSLDAGAPAGPAPAGATPAGGARSAEAAQRESERAAAEVAEALEEARRSIQAAIARQARLKRTPELVFKPDPVLRQAERVESILRDLGGA